MDNSTSYAGFLKRSKACLLDLIIIYIPVLFIICIMQMYMITFVMPKPSENVFEYIFELQLYVNYTMNIIPMVFIVLFSISYLLYCTGFESSRRQATPGKKAMGIKVTDIQGGRISFSKALIRNIGKVASSILLVGFIMIDFTEKKQALHDIIAGCLVTNTNVDV